MTEFISTSEQNELLDTAIIHGDFTLASGVHANRKFDFDLIETESELFQAVIRGLAKCIRYNFQDYNGILTIANGATRLGEPLSDELGVPAIESSYTIDASGYKHFNVNPDAKVSKVVLVDDVFTRGTNTTKTAIAAYNQEIESVGVAVVLDRSGFTKPTIAGRLAVKSLIKQDLS